MRKIKFVKTLVIFVCIGIYGYSAVDTNTGQMYNISIDAGKPLSIVWPVEVAVVGDNGEKGLRIGPKIGRGWRGEAGGEASYKFYIPQDNKYYIWAYCLWFDECANAIFAKFDDSDKAIIGNDPIYKQWHWVRGFNIHLGKGTHTLVLSNHSDHISLQKLLFTNSTSATPEDCTLMFSDIFYDGFDGCDRGNFANWEIISGNWIVQDPSQEMCLTENALIGKSTDSSFILYKGDDWSNYSLNVVFQPILSENAEGTVGICFGVKDSNQYHKLTWNRIEKPEVCKMQISRKTNEITKILSDFEIPWKTNRWHQVEIALNNNGIVVRMDDAKTIVTPIDYKIIGGIGFRLEGNLTACFDDVHIRQITETNR